MNPAPAERPWAPVDRDPNTIILINPQGTRHLAFDQRRGIWSRLWQHQPPQPMGADAAALLRPSDIDLVIMVSTNWIAQHPGDRRVPVLVDELARGAKTLVMYFAGRVRFSLWDGKTGRIQR